MRVVWRIACVGWAAGAQPSLWTDLSRLAMPAHLIVGERDTKFWQINARMAAGIPDARLAVIPVAGHNTHLEIPAAFSDALLSFLEGV